jgi:hypothetical protein
MRKGRAMGHARGAARESGAALARLSTSPWCVRAGRSCCCGRLLRAAAAAAAAEEVVVHAWQHGATFGGGRAKGQIEMDGRVVWG